MLKDDVLPQAIWSGSFKIFDVDVKCHVLDTGQRVIEEASMTALLDAMSEPGRVLNDADMMAFARWQKGM